MLPPHPPRPLLLLDYDGTLAPIVDNPARAAPHPDVPALLAALDARHPLVVVTGRDLETLARLLPVPVRAVGLHGAEEGRLGEAAAARAPHAEGALRAMRLTIPELPGMHVEEKGRAFAVHYRHAPDPRAARAALDAWAAAAPPALEPVEGKFVVELRPRGVSKGVAARALAAEHPACTPVFLGDDVTDEEAFRALAGARPDAVTIKVGEGETAARFRLPGVPEAVAYLRAFLA